MALFSIHFCGNKSFSTHKNSFLSFRSLSFCATCSFYFFSQSLSHFSPSENFPYNSISQRNSKKGGHFKLLTPALRCPLPQLPGANSMTTRICGVKSWTAIFSTTTVWTPRKIGAPKKGTSRFSSAPLRRRLHEFYFGGSQFVVLRAANWTAPDLSFRTPPRGATTRNENVPFLLAHQFSGESKLWRTEIFEEIQDPTPTNTMWSWKSTRKLR